jgi:hypothetical protein
MPRSPLRARSRISWGGDAFVVLLLARYNMLECWIEYTFLLGTEMSCCPVRANRALLIGPKYILSEVVARYLSIAQCAPFLEPEPRFGLQVRPYGRTMLQYGLRWSVTWWGWSVFCHRRVVDRYVLAGGIDRWVHARGIDRFPIATSYVADLSTFIVQISLRANSDNRVVIDGVPMSGHAGPLIKCLVSSCLTVAWNVVAK